MRALFAVILTLVVIALAAVAFYFFMVYSGTYSVIARPGVNGFLQDTLDKTMDHSVKYHAKNIQVPALDNPAMIKAGAQEYAQACVRCHGAPGIEQEEFTKGMDPQPPAYDDIGKNVPPASLFWVAKNGIEMTGMPAFRVTKNDQTLWGVVAVMKRLPTMSAGEYQNLTK